MSKALLKKIAADPDLKRVSRDTEEVKAMIAEDLARRPRTPAAP